jgi:quercetin dioxygenase-like cupin family protein
MTHLQNKLIEGDQFHYTDSPVYSGKDGKSFKYSDCMAHVRYHPAHPNPHAPEGEHGSGELVATWIYCEEPEKSEGVLNSGIELMMDSKLAPGASLGLHGHPRTEEIYYLLEGEVTVKLYSRDKKFVRTLTPGDAHLIKPGESHSVQAGPQGARFIAVAAAVPEKN